MARHLLVRDEIEFETPYLSEVVPFLRKLYGRGEIDDFDFMTNFAKNSLVGNYETYNCNRREAFARDMIANGDLRCLSEQTKKTEQEIMVEWSKDSFMKMFISSPTSLELKAWGKVADEFSIRANNVDDALIETIRSCANNGGYYNERYKHLNLQETTDLVRGIISYIVLNVAQNAFIEIPRSYQAQGCIYYTVPYAIQKYATFWEFTLGLPIGKEFVKSVLNYIADTMKMHPEQRHETISDKFPQPKLTSKSRLYFAYGSNMNHGQMKKRCPSAQFVGLGELNNFEYIIDARGVASIAPKNGASTWGVMWDIPDDHDWRTLDGCEGVSQSIYKRISTEVNMHPCEVYVSSTATRGKPRRGYQENIVASVQFHLKWYDNIIEKMTVGQREDYSNDCEGYTYSFELWENEMSSWLEGRN